MAKEHYSLYPISQRLSLDLKDELARIARFRAKEAAEGRKIKPSTRTT